MSFNAIRENKSLAKFSGFTVGLGVVLLRTPGTGFLVTGPKYEKKRSEYIFEPFQEPLVLIGYASNRMLRCDHANAL